MRFPATRSLSPRRLVAVVCAAQILAQIGAYAWPALIPGRIAAWGIDNTEAGWITGLFYLAYTVAVPVLVTLTHRVLPKRVYLFGVAVTVLPSTDLFLMHRDHDHNVPRGVAPVHRMLEHGVNCSLSTNNVLNPFTPFGDCSLLRMANLYANIAQIGKTDTLADCLAMVSTRSAGGAAGSSAMPRPSANAVRLVSTAAPFIRIASVSATTEIGMRPFCAARPSMMILPNMASPKRLCASPAMSAVPASSAWSDSRPR